MVAAFKVPSVKGTKMYIAPQKLDHFLSFTTSTHEKTLKLSSNVELKIPNVMRSLIPEQIV